MLRPKLTKIDRSFQVKRVKHEEYISVIRASLVVCFVATAMIVLLHGYYEAVINRHLFMHYANLTTDLTLTFSIRRLNASVHNLYIFTSPCNVM